MRRTPDLAEHCDQEVGCITCGDAAVELRVTAVDPHRGLARCVDDRGREETVETALVDLVAPDDLLLVHAATAIHKVAR